MSVATERKLAQAAEGVNGVALKVLGAVPIKEQWSKEQIGGELRRLGLNVSPAIVAGCLDTLRGRGLVREPQAGVFIRVAARVVEIEDARPQRLAPVAEPAQVVDVATPAQPVDEAAAPADRLGQLGAELRKLSRRLDAVATQIDAAALDAMQALEDARQEGGKLEQLRQMLRSL